MMSHQEENGFARVRACVCGATDRDVWETGAQRWAIKTTEGGQFMWVSQVQSKPAVPFPTLTCNRGCAFKIFYQKELSIKKDKVPEEEENLPLNVGGKVGMLYLAIEQHKGANSSCVCWPRMCQIQEP